MRTKVLLLALICVCMCHAQDEIDKLGMISLIPYVSDDSEIKGEAREYMIDKLSQMATVNGVSGSGVDNRFIITPNVRILKKNITATIPQKTAIRLSVTIYIGDGLEGTLFSSANKEITGFGDDDTQAYISAIRKLPVRDASFTHCVEEGKRRILNFYDQTADDIIKAAQATAASGDYQGAVRQLFAIPTQCRLYKQAQLMIAEISEKEIDNKNMELLNSARAAWGASPNAEGATQVQELLSRIEYPSDNVSAGINKLTAQISSRLTDIENKAWQRKMSEMQNAHEVEMAQIKSQERTNLAQIESHKQRSIAYINAAASVAKTYAATRPKVVYRIYHWW